MIWRRCMLAPAHTLHRSLKAVSLIEIGFIHARMLQYYIPPHYLPSGAIRQLERSLFMLWTAVCGCGSTYEPMHVASIYIASTVRCCMCAVRSTTVVCDVRGCTYVAVIV